ncbi:hypothetical protein BH11ACT4_BH11ACT4_13990 [soil metagenome]
MIPLIALKIVGAIAGVAALGAAAFAIVPAPDHQHGIWLDSPRDGATVVAGSIPLTMHSDLHGLFELIVEVTTGGKTVTSIADKDLEVTSRGAGAEPLSWFDKEWNADPGVYELRVMNCGSGGSCSEFLRSFTITVVEQAPVAVYEATAGGTATPTPTPTATPSPTPTPSATTVPAPPPASSSAPPPQVVYEMPYGFIRLTANDAARLNPVFSIQGATPQQAVGSVQVQVQPSGSPKSDAAWTTIPCSALQADPARAGTFTCSTQAYSVPPSSSGPRTGYYRLVLVNGDKTFVGDLQYWNITR